MTRIEGIADVSPERHPYPKVTSRDVQALDCEDTTRGRTAGIVRRDGAWAYRPVSDERE